MTWRLPDLRLPAEHPAPALRAAILDRLGIPDDALISYEIVRRGVDARKAPRISFVYTLDLELRDSEAGTTNLVRAPDTSYRPITSAPSHLANRPVVIGAGPCGLFAALTLAQMGFRPIILERGKPVRARTVDTFRLWRHSVLDPESNVQFGEGGAGTFSDGKLYSQIRDRQHHGRHVLRELVRAGAPIEILTASKPHIGTFRLVSIVENLRAEIERLGGEYRFGHQVIDFERSGGVLCALRLADGSTMACGYVVLAVGHSARDTFECLLSRGVHIEAKPFSIGVRIEHPQGLIDRARYRDESVRSALGAADYRLVHHCANGRSVYSFCMCPGGTVVAAASELGRVVTNGMSQYSRTERNANAGLVVGVSPADYPDGPLAGIAFQRHWEERAFVAGGRSYAAPAQLVGDFLVGRASISLGSVVPSYKPGVTPTDLAGCLPDFAVQALREALPALDRQLPGFAMSDAVMTGVETRTSSPIRIPRGRDGHSVNTRGLFPAGEGAGYAGGILSAAVDGIRVAEAVALELVGEGARADLRAGSGSYGQGEGFSTRSAAAE
jgi:uncharacterized FAD-dependent dehydrogenase